MAKASSGYVFDLRLLCGGYAYYSTYCQWEKWGEHGREFRKPRQVDLFAFAAQLSTLGHNLCFLKNTSDYQSWLMHRGWAAVPVKLAQASMPQWLKSQQCVHSPNGTFTDINICSPNALNHHASPGKRNAVIVRDGQKCVLCERTKDDEITLTMQHIRPRSKGGETTLKNLVALCEECNASLADVEYSNLYELAGVFHGFDIGLFKGKKFTKEDYFQIMHLSNNLMHTRCEVW